MELQLTTKLLSYSYRSASSKYHNSVFRVRVQGVVKDMMNPHMPGTSKDWKGSAFAVDIGGRTLFVTNHHVVESAKKISLSRVHGNVYLKVIAVCPGYDVALMESESGRFPASRNRFPLEIQMFSPGRRVFGA